MRFGGILSPLPSPPLIASRSSCGGFPRSVRGIFTPALVGLGRSYIGTRAPGPLPRGCLALPTRVYYHTSSGSSIPFLKKIKKIFSQKALDRHAPACYNIIRAGEERETLGPTMALPISRRIVRYLTKIRATGPIWPVPSTGRPWMRKKLACNAKFNSVPKHYSPGLAS